MTTSILHLPGDARRKPAWPQLDPSNRFAKKLAGAWFFAEGGGLIRDLSPYGTHGIPEGGVSRTVGQYGRDMTFDGDDDAVDLGSIPLGHPLQLTPGDGVGATIVVRMKHSNTADGFQRLIDKSSAGNGADGYYYALSADQPYFHIGGGSGKTDNAGALTADTWYTLAVVADDVNDEFRFYRDAVLSTTQANTFSGFNNVVTNARIGTWNHSTGREFGGTIDYLCVWNRKLSVDELREMHERPYQFITPRRFIPLGQTAAAAGLSIPVAMHHYKQMMVA